ncbi:POT family proton-dependent oligopeptide transporter [Mesonia algae]|uniref:POT family proton-dependent oligopeptide transporter n=1 Tax=Mesonia algae TaxID=213248 RepID=A0A2W7ICN6_9FLAO|nr:peptide MFS transporter [Mesonia algae]PZW43868.1 POT family proton-dependent oligopeptide transporter [Mesonia algae]
MSTLSSTQHDEFFKSKVLGHPAGLFVLFFTEMWERFSFYGMRVLLINFLTMAIVGVDFPGWGWSAENAGALFGTYAGLLYLTPIVGGLIADKLIGYRWAVVVGSILMTLGHAAMAIETEIMLYVGLGFLILGTGFFKPNITSIISEMYKYLPEKKDGAYTIFYMGVNAGAFFGMLLCGYLAEKLGWSWGFGLAGIFMLLGTLQFWLSKPLFGTVGGVPEKGKEIEVSEEEKKDYKANPFTMIDKVLIVASTIIGFLYLINDPVSKIGKVDLLPQKFFVDLSFGGEPISGSIGYALVGLLLFLVLVIRRISRYSKVVRDRMIAVVVFAFFTVIFFLCFEQAASSLVLFARDSVDRELTGAAALSFNIINALLTVIPLGIITWVLVSLWKQTHTKILGANIVLMLCFLGIWALVLWMLYREFSGGDVEITVSWFSILNSFFIIAFASFFSKWWESKYNPSAALKYGIGLVLVGLGFGLLAFGSYDLAEGVKVSMVWLILAYLFHTLGELCLSPVGLSYVSKLVPARMIALMFGMWYLAIAIGNKIAASLGGMVDQIKEDYSLSTFFLIFTIIPIAAGVLVAVLNPLLKKLMHGVK